MGHEYLSMFTASDKDKVLSNRYNYGDSVPLQFVGDMSSSFVFADMPWQDRLFLATHNSTLQLHDFSVSPETMLDDTRLSEFWKITSISQLPNTGKSFVATMEARDYPFFSTQFHPEKVTQAWIDSYPGYQKYNVDQSWDSIRIQRHFANKLVKLARANENSFGNYTELMPYLI